MENRFNFRCWLIKQNRMIEDFSLFGFGSKSKYKRDIEEVVDDGNNFITYHWIETILMQSTALKDKNNKEIFEGDIIKLFDDAENVVQLVYSVPNASFEYHDKKNMFVSSMCDIDLKYAEVIGNIYENKELIKE